MSSGHQERARDLLRAARDAEESDLGGLTVSLARTVLNWARDLETWEDGRQRRALKEILHSEQSQQFSLALTDRVHRSTDPAVTVEAVRRLVKRLQREDWLPALDRAQLRALTAFGPAIPGMAVEAVKARLKSEAEPFVLDATPYELGVRLDHCRRSGARVNLNYLGEEVLGEREARRTLSDYLALLARPDVDALSIKLSNVYSQLSLLDFEGSATTLVERLVPVFAAAIEHDKLLYFDMEAFHDLTLTYAVFERLLARDDLLEARAGLAVQAYVPDSLPLVQRLLELAQARVARGGAPVRMRLVKGANLAMETVEASRHRWEHPVFSTKSQVDAHYKRLLRLLVDGTHRGRVVLGVGSHNVFDLCYALLLREMRDARDLVQLEMLHGMAGAVGRVFEELSGGLLLYAPCVLPENFSSAISYLVRRLDENTGARNFLRTGLDMRPGDASFQAESERFLLSLSESHQFVVPSFRTQSQTDISIPRSSLDVPFDNEPDTDFTRAPNRHLLRALMEEVATTQQRFAFAVAGCNASGIETPGHDPSKPGETAYVYFRAGPSEVAAALDTADRAREAWGGVPGRRRAEIVDAVANVLAQRRARLVAVMVKDAGKRAGEADIEVSEAIDFARYYARSYLQQQASHELEPRGVTVVTPPWNFPAAIPLGGCLAALVAGNPVVFKPAPETPLVAYELYQACLEAGVPEQALSFLPCDDVDASPLVRDSRVATVVLTGATSTALKFVSMRPGLRLLAETGGKNGAYVSPLSDREQAIGHIVASAFGHAGQKCSALSQLVLHEEVFRDSRFQSMLLDATESLHVGSAHRPSSFVTPLIRPAEGALAKVLELPASQWLLPPRRDADNPQLWSPGILWDVQAGEAAHQTEFFGPVLAVLEARDLAHALRIMNGTPYGLTAGFFGLDECEQERFVEGMDAGNLYLNRGITGAIVGRQPFGGRKASSFGPGAKAGGPGYVLQFCRVGPRKASSSASRGTANKSLAHVMPAHFSLTEPSSERLTLEQVLPPQPGTEAHGELNTLRYQAHLTAIVPFADAEAGDVWKARRAQSISGGPELVVPAEHLEALQRQLQQRGCNRLRLIGSANPEFLKLAASEGWVLLDDPVHDSAEIETRLFVKEQSISAAFHRYGNTSLSSLSSLNRLGKASDSSADSSKPPRASNQESTNE